MKRRKTKTVQFAAPTYVDYSDIDYSTEEEDVEAEYLAQQQQQQRQQGQQAQQAQQSASELEMDDESAKVEPLKSRSQQKGAKAEPKKQEVGGDAESSATSQILSRVSEETEVKAADGPKKSSDGTVRDSFFKDDSVETKKITLTPNLLRDDNGTRTSTESREMKQRPSLDKLDKDSILGKDDKKKKKEKEKDKKSGGLRSFFSRKDKKAKGDEDDDSFGKRSMDADAPEKDMEDEEPQPSPERAGPQRQTSKLQKQQPRAEPSPTRKPNGGRENGVDIKAFLSEGKVNNVANNPPTSMRLVEASPKASPDANIREQVGNNTPSRPPRGESRPQKTMQTKSRMDLDEDSSDEDLAPAPTRQAPVPEEAARQQARAAPVITPLERDQTPEPVVQPANTAPKITTAPPQQPTGRLSESPVQVSPITNSDPPPLLGDSSSQEEDRVSPRSTPSPEFIEHEDADTSGHKDSMTATTASPTSRSSSSWDDVGLRAFFDSGSDIRDLLVVVFDKTSVDPEPRSDHPVATSLFREQNAKLAEITTVSFVLVMIFVVGIC
jgi:hypothetical protein